jgi:NADP-dependent 3-hydroxy acid dehydrogenase YdfG
LLLYNAEVYIAETAWGVTEEDHMKMMSVNYFTPMRIVKGLFPLLEGHHVGVVASLASIMDRSTCFLM